MAHPLGGGSAPPTHPDPALPNRPPLDGKEVWQARLDLAACFRFAARLGLHEGICNHFSAMLPEAEVVRIPNRVGGWPQARWQIGWLSTQSA